MRSRKTKEPQSRSKKGFTLAELLIVVAIIGVLVAISIPIFSSQLEKSRKAVDVDNCRAIKSALAMAMIDGSLKITPTNTIKDPCILIVYYKKTKEHTLQMEVFIRLMAIRLRSVQRAGTPFPSMGQRTATLMASGAIS